ncbi:MAG TPA: YtxH domain-containing protein [Candidatus Angelobacter sp.]|nr:YtxH domain-containing protein [Candidatus Angelobacter sp.]
MSIGKTNPERWSDYRFSKPDAGGNAGVFLLAGLAIGVALALLLAPMSGPDLRRAIGRGYRKTIDGVSGQARDLREKAHNLGGDLRERMPNLLRFGRRLGAGLNSGE